MRGCEQVYHLAALIAELPWPWHLQGYVDTNIPGTLNVVQAARDLGVSRVIHLHIRDLRDRQFVPIREDHPLVGQSPYAASKIGADQIALSYWRSFETHRYRTATFQHLRAPPECTCSHFLQSLVNRRRTADSLGALSPTRDFNYVVIPAYFLVCSGKRGHPWQGD